MHARQAAISAALVIGTATTVCAQSSATGELSYQGWHAGMPMDSARALSLRDTGKQLACFTMDPANAFCTARNDHVAVQLALSLTGKVIESIEITRDVPASYPRATLRKQLSDTWGAPDSVSAIRQREPASKLLTVVWYGHWNRGREYAFAYEISGKGVRSIRIKLADREALLATEERMGLRPPPLERFKP